MLIKFFNSWIVWLALVSLAGCYAPQDEDPDIIVTLDPEFTVDLFEQRDSLNGAPTFGLWVESMQQFDCGNYQIDALVTVSSNEINIQLQEIRTPDSCLGAPSAAKGFLPIGDLADGMYDFRLSLNPVIVSKGVLVVQNGHYELLIPNPQGIDFQNRVLEALPEGYVWGYALTPDEQDQPVADQFVQNLKTLTQEPVLTPGFYSYFTVSGTGQYYFHRSIAPMGQHRPFLRRLSDDMQGSVRNLLQGYRNAPSQALEISCLSTFGAL
jgi:hypothetical protein